MNTPSDAQHDRKSARIRLAGMGATYAMGTFNDNFFKQAALLLAATASMHSIQGLATVLFALPFALFSAWTGWLADCFSKRSIVILSKFFELGAMLVGLWALYTLNWNGIVAVIFLMAVQSTLFSPALNGAIPENFPSHTVPRVNALLKLATTSTILLGMALGGIILDLPPPAFAQNYVPQGPYGFGRLAVTVLAVAVSVAGIAAALCISKGAPARTGEAGLAPFPWFGPIDSVRHAFACYTQDKHLFLVLTGEAFFYSVSSFAILCINNLGVNELGFSTTVTSLLSVALMVGVCAGSLVAGRREASSWRQLMVPAGAGMALGLLLSALAPLLPPGLRLGFLLVLFVLAGICGGIYLIPLASYIQVRPGPREKGKVLGISNFASFVGIFASGLVFTAGGGIAPSLLLAGSGLVGLLFAAWAATFIARLPEASLADKASGLAGLLLRGILSLRYRVSVTGLADIAAADPTGKPVLFLPNHPALIDPPIIYALLAGLRPPPLVDERQMRGPLGGLVAKLTQAVLMPDPAKNRAKARQGVEQALATVTEALRAGDSVLLYPAGRVYRSSAENLRASSATASILAQMPDVRVVLVRTTGLWGSSFSHARGKAPDFAHALLQGFCDIAANLLLFAPRRKVLVEFTEHPDLPRDGDKRKLNAWLEAFYNATEQPPVFVPRFFWQSKA